MEWTTWKVREKLKARKEGDRVERNSEWESFKCEASKFRLRIYLSFKPLTLCTAYCYSSNVFGNRCESKVGSEQGLDFMKS
ncbi:hypothetical protein VNO77_28326 [Canavalia gladiata]|uniref:Uncharacterized protein n=1 Tax=Canavalia gladiata TaxID=3824 RepID=A0AAN9KVD9_CANGL